MFFFCIFSIKINLLEATYYILTGLDCQLATTVTIELTRLQARLKKIVESAATAKNVNNQGTLTAGKGSVLLTLLSYLLL